MDKKDAGRPVRRPREEEPMRRDEFPAGPGSSTVGKDRPIPLESLIRMNASPSFGPFFAEKVMRRLAAEAAANSGREGFCRSLVDVSRPLLAGIAVLCIGLISYNLLAGGHFSVVSLFALNDVTLEDVFVPTFSVLL
jgi:hypothetical protein